LSSTKAEAGIARPLPISQGNRLDTQVVLDAVAAALKARCGIGAAAKIVVGVSGGADSLCLMHVLRQLGHEVIVAHFDHKLRPGSDREARAVAKTAARLSLPFVEAAADIRAEARQKGMSLEDAARHARYTFLLDQARRHDAQAVAVAHTADDQIETMLMHLIRGSGLDGLAGMAYRTVLVEFHPSIPVVRPLLGVWKDATLGYCEASGLVPAHDPSNDSVEFFRNRVRHQLIPSLEAYNPQIRRALLQTAELLSDDQAFLAAKIQADWDKTVVHQMPAYVSFDGERLAQLERAEQRYVLRLALRHICPGLETGYGMLNRAASFAADISRMREALSPEITLIREGPLFHVCRDDEVLPTDAWPQLSSDRAPVSVTVPALIRLPGGWQLTSEVCAEIQAAIQQRNDPDPYQVWLDAESLPAALELRTPRAGDRFRPLGLDGHSQKLSDFFVNAKVPRRARRSWPLLCHGDLILWIPGFRPAEEFRIRAETRQAFHFSLRKAN
jgi:tRNA(Ile)-lysidine synthase